MSNILKGILNETSPHNYDSDWDYQNAVARSGKPRSSYRSQEDDTFDSDVAYSRKMYQLGQQQKAAREKAQRDSDHDRLASGTNEDITEASNPYEPIMIQGYDKWIKLVSVPNVDRHAYKSDITAVTSLGDVIGEFNTDKDLGYVIKKYAKGVSEGLDDPWGDQGNFAGDKPVNLGGVSIKNIQVGDTVKYFGQPSKVVAMSKDRKYSRITISKGMGTVTQDVLTSDLQQLGQVNAIEENDNIQTRMRMDDYYKLADAIQEKLKQAIQMGDNELVHKLSKERADLDTRVKKYGLMPESEQLDELSNEKLAQYKTAAALDAGKADKEGDYKRGDKRFSGIVKATKKQFANDTKKSGISQGISEDRFNSKQEVINHFVKNGKSAAAGAAAWERGYRGSSKKPIEIKKPPQRSYHDELDDKRYSTFENLGDQLKSNSLNALVQAKLAIEQQRQAEIEAWKRDFEKNTIQKAQQGLRREFEPTPVAQPGEKHSVLKARLAQLNNAIQKQELLDKLVDRLERKGLLTPAMQNDTDTRMHVRYGAKDNYESLNKKLDNAIQTLQSRLNVRKISGLKEVHDDRDEYDNPRQGRDYGKGNLFVDPGSNEFKKEVHPSDPNVERGRPKNLKGVSKALPADAFGRTTGKIPDSARPTSKEDPFKDVDEDLDENLHKWFQEKWVRFGPDGKIRGDCARGDDSEGKPKCLPQSKAQNLGKAGRASAASRKRREDPNPERSGKAINVNTKKKTNEEQLDELSCWSGYHRVKGTKAGFPGSCAKNKTNESEHSESCPHCGGEMVSEELMNEKKDACYYKVKSRYKVWPSAYASGALVKCRKKGASNWGTGGKSNESIEEDQLDEKWTKKYKDSINCSNPKGFSQKAHCAGKQKNESSIMQGLNQIDEGWKEKLGAAALTGAMALGAAGANARVTPGDDPNINRLTGKPNITQPVQTQTQTPTKAEAPKGFSKEYRQSVVNGTHPRPMISVEKAQELLKQGQ